MGYLIDTCILVDVQRGRVGAADLAHITQNEPVFLSPITIAELMFGALISKHPDEKQRRLAAVQRLVDKPILPINEGTGQTFAQIAAELKHQKRGHEFRIQDIWIASQAVQYGLFLLTSNLKDFADVPGLSITPVSAK